MEKKIGLLVLFLLLFSCFEEQPLPGFIKQTTWVKYKSGSIYDEHEKYLYSYMETHTMMFSEDSFKYALNRKETAEGGRSYADVLNQEIAGTYTVKYPKVYFHAATYEKVGLLSLTSSGIGVLTIDTGSQGQSVSLVKR
jgi:hypothetical protein